MDKALFGSMCIFIGLIGGAYLSISAIPEGNTTQFFSGLAFCLALTYVGVHFH